MDAWVEDGITPVLDRLAIRLTTMAAEAVRASVNKAVREFEQKVPVAKYVHINDKVGDYPAQLHPITIMPTREGVEITVRPFYAAAYDFKIQHAVGLGGNVAKLTRQGLWVHKRVGGKPTHSGAGNFVDFQGSARLRQWAEDHDELKRRAVLIDSTVEISYLWGPIRAQLILDIHRELGLSLRREKLGG